MGWESLDAVDARGDEVSSGTRAKERKIEAAAAQGDTLYETVVTTGFLLQT